MTILTCVESRNSSYRMLYICFCSSFNWHMIMVGTSFVKYY